jgi:hypothetical protein
MKVLQWCLVPRTCALARPCRTDEPSGALGTSVAPSFHQLLRNGHARSGKRGIRGFPFRDRCGSSRQTRDSPHPASCHCEGARPKQSPTRLASRRSSFPRTRESRLDPGSESGVTNYGQSGVLRETVPPMRLLRRSTPRNDTPRRGNCRESCRSAGRMDDRQDAGPTGRSCNSKAATFLGVFALRNGFLGAIVFLLWTLATYPETLCIVESYKRPAFYGPIWSDHSL